MSSTTDRIPSGLELLRAAADLPATEHRIGGLLGIHVEEVSEGAVSFSLDTRPDFADPLGSVHGGIFATLLNSAMGYAVHTTLGPGVRYGTLELKVNCVRTVPANGVDLHATGRAIHAGRKVATAEGRVEDYRGRFVAHGTTCLMYPAV